MEGYFWLHENAEFSSLEDAIKYAEENDFTTIYGAVDGCLKEFEKCRICENWFDTDELWQDDACEKCYDEIRNFKMPSWNSSISLGVRFGVPR